MDKKLKDIKNLVGVAQVFNDSNSAASSSMYTAPAPQVDAPEEEKLAYIRGLSYVPGLGYAD